jgi:GGDEF domain-containing protein
MIKELVKKRITSWIVIIAIIFVFFNAAYFYVAFQTKISLVDATMADSFNDFFNLATIQILTFAGIIIALLFIIIFMLRFYYLDRKEILFDSLTGFYKKTPFIFGLKSEISRAKRFNHPLSFAIIELNEKKSPPIKIKKIAQIIKKEIRNYDIAGRRGYNQFEIIFPEIKKEIAVKICDNIKKSALSFDIQIRIGVAENSFNSNLIREARKNLYLSKLADR